MENLFRYAVKYTNIHLLLPAFYVMALFLVNKINLSKFGLFHLHFTVRQNMLRKCLFLSLITNRAQSD